MLAKEHRALFSLLRKKVVYIMLRFFNKVTSGKPECRIPLSNNDVQAGRIRENVVLGGKVRLPSKGVERSFIRAISQ